MRYQKSMEKPDHPFLGHFSPSGVALDLQELVANWQWVATIFLHPPAGITRQIQQMEKHIFRSFHWKMVVCSGMVRRSRVRQPMTLCPLLYVIPRWSPEHLFLSTFRKKSSFSPISRQWGQLKKSPVFLWAFCWLWHTRGTMQVSWFCSHQLAPWSRTNFTTISIRTSTILHRRCGWEC